MAQNIAYTPFKCIGSDFPLIPPGKCCTGNLEFSGNVVSYLTGGMFLAISKSFHARTRQNLFMGKFGGTEHKTGCDRSGVV